jgi:hypothetical protein
MYAQRKVPIPNAFFEVSLTILTLMLVYCGFRYVVPKLITHEDTTLY